METKKEKKDQKVESLEVNRDKISNSDIEQFLDDEMNEIHGGKNAAQREQEEDSCKCLAIAFA
ncbi:MAG: hypothetical protein LBN24_05065 [Mediterranea sp.]|jgi:hypothetical protein|nr:hypothetical protein [Mediterranea sp.]